MSTLVTLKSRAAAILERDVADFTVNGVDLWLEAANDAKRNASMNHDFNFQRKLLTLTVNSATGGSLDDAVIQGTATGVDLKTIIEMGNFDTYGNFRPVMWTTEEMGQELMRQENPFYGIRYPTDAQALSWPLGQRRLVIRGDSIFNWPIADVPVYDQVIGIEAYVFDSEWDSINSSTTITVTGTLNPDLTGIYSRSGTLNALPFFVKTTVDGEPLSFIFADSEGDSWDIAQAVIPGPTNFFGRNDLTVDGPEGVYTANGTYTGTATVVNNTANDPWLTKGSQYILWQSIIELNKRIRSFVPRQEGNLGEPQAMSDAGLAAFISWDIFKYEGFRRDTR